MVAVIETGGKQYCVKPGQRITVARLTDKEGATVRFSNLLGGNAVTAEVMAHVKAPKVVSRKFRNKTRYHRVKGHRQPITLIQIASGEAKKSQKEQGDESAE